MAILVTGGAGFIGSHIAEYFAGQSDQETLVIDNLSGGRGENVPQGCIFLVGDITDVDFIQEVFTRYPIHYVFHCAAYAAEVLSHHIRRFNYENNVVGSVNLINAAINHGVEHFVFLSSAAVYGRYQGICHEDVQPQPIDPYGIAKLAVEMDLRAAHELFGLGYTIFRLHNVYGERQNIQDRYRNVIGIFMNQALRGDPLTIFGDGEQTRAFTYVRDIVPIIAQSITDERLGQGVFNLGSDMTTSINELVDHLKPIVGLDMQCAHQHARHEVRYVRLSHDKIKSVLGELPYTPLPVGLRNMYDWCQGHEFVGETGYFEAIEIRRHLPELWRENPSP